MKKTKTMTTDEQQFAEAVRASAQQIWQAGLGAFGKAQQESSKMFANLIKEGKEAQSRHADAEQAHQSKHFSAMSDQEFEQGVARALDKLEMPTKKDLHALSLQLDALQQAVLALTKKAAPTAAKKSPVTLSTAVSRKKTVASKDKVLGASKPKPSTARKKAIR